jgi:hypothetical protein
MNAQEIFPKRKRNWKMVTAQILAYYIAFPINLRIKWDYYAMQFHLLTYSEIKL